jgi:hypothetical protein
MGALHHTWAVLTERPTYRPSPYDRTRLRQGANGALFVFAAMIFLLALSLPLLLVLASAMFSALALGLLMAGLIMVVEGFGGVG